MENKKLRTPIAPLFLAAAVLIRLINMLSVGVQFVGFLNIVSFAVDAFVCYILFAKKRDNLLVIAVGVATVMSLVSLLTGFGLASLLSFVADAALLAYAVAVSEQTLLNVDLSQVKDLGGKFYYAPAALSLLANVISWINAMRFLGFIPFISFVSGLLGCAYALFLAMWLKDPYEKPAAPVAESGSTVGGGAAAFGGAYCSLGKHIVLCLFTFGIWPLIWTHRTTKFLNCAPNAPYYDPTKKLLLCLFIPFYQLYWYYKHGQRIDALSREKGLNNSDMATMCLVLGIFIPIVATILMQDRINGIYMAMAAEEQ